MSFPLVPSLMRPRTSPDVPMVSVHVASSVVPGRPARVPIAVATILRVPRIIRRNRDVGINVPCGAARGMSL